MRSSEPQFSVCIRAHSRREGLRRAVRSALEQDSPDLEVVISDDSGTLEDVAASFGDDRVRYHRNPGPGGSIANLRHVTSLARGEMVVVVDDDDRLLPGFLTAAGEPMRRDASIGVVFTDFLREAGSASRRYDFPVPPGAVADPLSLILTGHQPGRSSTLIRAEALQQGEAAYPLLDDHVGDLTTWLRTAAAGWGFHYVPEPLALVSVHGGQLSASEHPSRLIRTLERFEFPEAPAAEQARRDRLADARRRHALNLASRGQVREARHELARATVAAPWPPIRHTVASLASNAPALHRVSIRHPRIGNVFRDVRSRLLGSSS